MQAKDTKISLNFQLPGGWKLPGKKG